MSKIQEAASYRGVVVEHAVGVTNSGLPQFVAKFRALERYDSQDKTWISWVEREDCEITAYLVLIDKKGNPIFHAKDVQKVFEWDGASLTGLNLLDLENAEVQFEVQDHEYEGKESTQVSSIRGYNDEPGNSVKKLDDDELAQLNAKFGSTLKKMSGGPKVAKAGKSATATAAAKKKGTTKKKAAAPPPPAAPTEEEATDEASKEVPEVPVEEAIEEFKKENKVPPPPASAPKAPPAPPAKESATAPALALAPMTYELAWALCYEKKAKTVDDKTIAAAFSAAMHRQAPGMSETEIPGEDWALIAEAVVGECG